MYLESIIQSEVSQKEKNNYHILIYIYMESRLLTVPGTARRSNQSILRELDPEYSLEGLMLKLKCQYFGHLMRTDWGQKDKRVSEDEMAEWHHQCNGHELGQALGDGEGRGSLAYCSPWGCKELVTTRGMNNNNMQSRKMVLMNLYAGEQWNAGIGNRLVDTVGEGEDGTNWESRTEAYTLPHVKQIASGNLL